MSYSLLKSYSYSGSSTGVGANLYFQNNELAPEGSLLLAVISVNTASRVPSLPSEWLKVADWPMDASGCATYAFIKEADGTERGVSITMTGEGAYNWGRAIFAFDGLSIGSLSYSNAKVFESGRVYELESPIVETTSLVLSGISRVGTISEWNNGEELCNVGRLSIVAQSSDSYMDLTATASSNAIARGFHIAIPMSSDSDLLILEDSEWGTALVNIGIAEDSDVPPQKKVVDSDWGVTTFTISEPQPPASPGSDFQPVIYDFDRNNWTVGTPVVYDFGLGDWAIEPILSSDPDAVSNAERESLYLNKDREGLLNWHKNNSGPRQAPTRTYTDLTVLTESWLESREGDGNVYRLSDGWLISRARFDGGVRLYADNVTVRDFVVSSGGGYFGISTAPNDNPKGIRFEYGTLDGGGAANYSGVEILEAVNPDQITLYRLDISGYRVGDRIIGGQTVKQCYFHDLVYSEGSHNTSASIRARNVKLLESWLGDGNSAALSLYNEVAPYTGILISKNVFETSKADYEVAYLGSYPHGSNSVELLDNLFSRGALAYQSGNFSLISGNQTFSGEPVN